MSARSNAGLRFCWRTGTCRSRISRQGSEAVIGYGQLRVAGEGVRATQLRGGVRRMALAAEHREGMIKRGGDVEEPIQVRARQHFVDERTRVDQLQMDLVAFA